MIRVLYIGDPHIRPDCIEEGEKLVDHICKVASENAVDYVCLLGDLFHTHSVVHLSVMAFWQRAFQKINDSMNTPDETRVYSLVGNHDMSGKAGDTANALMLYTDGYVEVVNTPTQAPWGAILMPYFADHAEFIENANYMRSYYGNNVLVCHQTFDGSQYENGFYAKDGIDPNLLKYDHVISGHIHTPQQIGKVWYPGSPRWQTVADANTQRAIWMVDHDSEAGTVTGHTAFDTSGVCRPIFCFEDRQESPVVMPEGSADVIVDVYGTVEYVKARAEALEALGARVRQFPDTERVIKVKESDGLPASMRKFLTQYSPQNGTDIARLLELAENRISWMKTAS